MRRALSLAPRERERRSIDFSTDMSTDDEEATNNAAQSAHVNGTRQNWSGRETNGVLHQHATLVFSCVLVTVEIIRIDLLLLYGRALRKSKRYLFERSSR